mmetsp:Transcript_7001/g.19015  ORF Transcript_7001/g.19015 Transcript_7001/m.19015 type:complete len:116 (-) Transcript_7001:53-400(-)
MLPNSSKHPRCRKQNLTRIRNCRRGGAPRDDHPHPKQLNQRAGKAARTATRGMARDIIVCCSTRVFPIVFDEVGPGKFCSHSRSMLCCDVRNVEEEERSAIGEADGTSDRQNGWK